VTGSVMRSFEYEGAFLAVQPIARFRAWCYGDFANAMHSVSSLWGHVWRGFAANYSAKFEVSGATGGKGTDTFSAGLDRFAGSRGLPSRWQLCGKGVSPLGDGSRLRRSTSIVACRFTLPRPGSRSPRV
jgi:hypothetical protein